MIFKLFLTFSVITVVYSSPCRGGAVLDPSGKYCYLIGSRYYNFGDAEKGCHDYGGYHLAVINNMVDNNFLAKLAYSAGYDNLFIGATDVTGSWEWLDGSKMSFVNWAPAPKVGSCAVFRSTDGKWLRDTCEDKRSFICYGPAVGAPTDKPTTPATTTKPIYHEGQFLMFVGDAESLGNPNNHTDRAAFYTKEANFIQAVGDHIFTFNTYPEDNLVCSVWADQSWYGWVNFQQQFQDGYSEDKDGFDHDMSKLNFTDFTYQMNNISTAITALSGFHWYPAPDDFGYTTLVFFTGHQDFTGVPSLFDPWPYAVSEILVVQMNGSKMPVPKNDPRVSVVSISSNFNDNDLKSVTLALKCH